MDVLFYFIKKNWIFFAIMLVITALVVFTGISQKPQKKPSFNDIPTATPTPFYKSSSNSTTQKIYSLQKTIINNTKDSEIQGLPDVIKTETLPNNTKEYLLNSPASLSRPNKIITQNGIVRYEQIITDETNPASVTYATISRYKNVFGNPEKAIKGSRYYGSFMNTYIYASRGFALIGNPYTDEVFEVQTFVPTIVDKYIENYGQDIDLMPAPGGQ